MLYLSVTSHAPRIYKGFAGGEVGEGFTEPLTPQGIPYDIPVHPADPTPRLKK